MLHAYTRHPPALFDPTPYVDDVDDDVLEPEDHVRRDALPEHANYYRDEGCELAPSCLACPLPQCRYDTPTGGRWLGNRPRDAEILELRRGGKLIEEIAEHFRVSRRTVFRVLAANRS